MKRPAVTELTEYQNKPLVSIQRREVIRSDSQSTVKTQTYSRCPQKLPMYPFGHWQWSPSHSPPFIHLTLHCWALTRQQRRGQKGFIVVNGSLLVRTDVSRLFLLSHSASFSICVKNLMKNVHDLAAQVGAICPSGHVQMLGLEQKPSPQPLRQIAVIESM